MFGSRNFLFARSAAGGGNILFLWGVNNFGQLGLGDTANRSSPVQVGTSTTWSQIDTGKHTLAVNSAGELWAWGRNNGGELGQNNTISRSSPVQVGALTNWAKPFVGSGDSLCIKSDGTLWSWGLNAAASLGLGNSTSYSSPKQIGSNTNWATVGINSGNNNAAVLAVDTAGKLFAWGKNSQGQLGLGDVTNRDSPVQVGALTNWKTPSCGVYFSLCSKTDGTLWSMGSQSYGELGINNTTSYSSPKQVGSLTNWDTPAAGTDAVVCTKTDGTLWSWGRGASGMLGLNNTIAYSSPKQVGALTNWSIPTRANFATFCVKTDGTIWSWGYNGSFGGALGLNDIANRSSPVQIGSSTTWTVPAAGYFNGGCLKQPPTSAPSNVSVPVVTGATTEGSTLTSTTGTWNNDPYSFTFQWQRGTSNIGGATSSTYVIVSADVGSTLRCVVTATNAKGSASANSANTAVVTVIQGQLWNWGSGVVGQLGKNNVISYSSPVQVGSSTNWTYSAMGQYTSLAVNSLGQLWSWGTNTTWGQLGLNDTDRRSSPTQVGALTTWQKVFNDQQVCCAIKTDGTLWAWGRNTEGQLGDGTTTNRSSPVQITGSTNWVTASVGGAFGGTFAINSLGELWATGNNTNFGQLGLNDTTNRSSLTQVPGANWKNVFAGQATCHAIKTDGTLWGWGRANDGVIGNNSNVYRSSPVQIGSDTNWSNVRKASNYSTAAVRTNGTLWTWGENGSGSLGLNDTIKRSSPVQVGSLTTWVRVTNAGTYGCLARKTDGTLWTWGSNSSGGLGIGDTYARSSPVQIGSLTTWVINGFGGSNGGNSSAIKTP